MNNSIVRALVQRARSALTEKAAFAWTKNKSRLLTSSTTFCTNVMIKLMNLHSDTRVMSCFRLPVAAAFLRNGTSSHDYSFMLCPKCLKIYMRNDGPTLNAADHVWLGSYCSLVDEQLTFHKSFMHCSICPKLHICDEVLPLEAPAHI